MGKGLPGGRRQAGNIDYRPAPRSFVLPDRPHRAFLWPMRWKVTPRKRYSMSQECRLVSMHGLLRLLRLLIRAQLIR